MTAAVFEVAVERAVLVLLVASAAAATTALEPWEAASDIACDRDDDMEAERVLLTELIVAVSDDVVDDWAVEIRTLTSSDRDLMAVETRVSIVPPDCVMAAMRLSKLRTE